MTTLHREGSPGDVARRSARREREKSRTGGLEPVRGVPRAGCTPEISRLGRKSWAVDRRGRAGWGGWEAPGGVLKGVGWETRRRGFPRGGWEGRAFGGGGQVTHRRAGRAVWSPKCVASLRAGPCGRAVGGCGECVCVGGGMTWCGRWPVQLEVTTDPTPASGLTCSLRSLYVVRHHVRHVESFCPGGLSRADGRSRGWVVDDSSAKR